MNNTYGESAYNSQQVKPQPHVKEGLFGLWQKLISTGSHFSFNRLSNNCVTSLIADFTPSMWPKVQQDINNNQLPWWNEQRLEQYQLSGWINLYIYIAVFAQVLCVFFSRYVFCQQY